MSIPFAINGLGRIGRALLRTARQHPQLRLVAINDLAPAAALARLVARDSIHGCFDGRVEADGDDLVLDGVRVPVYREPDPSDVPWRETGPRIVVEATGATQTGAFARRHLGGPVERVVAAWNPSVEPPDVDLTICLGVNESSFDPRRHRVVSNSSCTSNCIAPVVSVLHRAYGVRTGLANTIHSVTNNQALLDAALPDPRRSRSALLNLVPVRSRAARAVGWLIPELAGRLDGFAVRVPAPDVALLDLVVVLEQPAEAEQVRQLFRTAAAGELRGILGVSEEELVSSDFIGDPRSAIVDLPLLQRTGDDLLRVVAWYDNEWGYASRLAELLLLLGTVDANPERSQR